MIGSNLAEVDAKGQITYEQKRTGDFDEQCGNQDAARAWGDSFL
jgi:hypothetical protein